MSSASVILSIYFLAGAAAVAIYLALSSGQRQLKDKMEDLAIEARVSRGVFELRPGEADGLARGLVMWAARRMPSPRLDTRSAGKLIQTLQQAGYRRAAAFKTFQLVRFGLCAGVTLAALAVAVVENATGASAIFLIIGGAVAGAFAPNYYLSRRARKRQAAIARELSDVLDLLVVCVEAGMGLHESIKIVGSEVEQQGQEIGRELALVSAEMSAGRSMGEALRAFADRTAIEDLKPLAATLIQSEQMGAQIAPALRGSSDMLRASRRLRAEEEAQKSTIKILFPLVLFVLPAMLIVIVGPAILQIMHTMSP